MDGKYQTRDGRAVRILAVDIPSCEPVAACVYDEHGGAGVYSYSADGAFNTGPNSPWDLIPVPVKRTGWVNIYSEEDYGCHYKFSETREGADKRAGSDRIACVQITFTDGEGLCPKP
jgi:hypothetical protein